MHNARRNRGYYVRATRRNQPQFLQVNRLIAILILFKIPYQNYPVGADVLVIMLGPATVALGVPLYSNAAGVIPVVQALMAKGAALGTVLAFMMSVVALSLPELIILRRVLKPRLIATFVGVVATGIIAIGYLFNVLL